MSEQLHTNQPSGGGKERFSRLKNAFATSCIVRFFTSYRAFDQNINQNFFSRLFKKIRVQKAWNGLKHSVQTNIEQSRMVDWISRFSTMLLHTPFSQYSAFFFVLSICGIFSYFYTGITFFQEVPQQPELQILLPSIACLIIAIAICTSRKTLAQAIKESSWGSILCFKILGVRTNTFDDPVPTKLSPVHFGLWGAAFGAASFLFPISNVLATLAAIILSYLVLLTPECGLIILLFLIPFCDINILFFGFLFVSIAFFLKVLQDKRAFHMRGMDYAVLLFFITLLLCGSISSAWRSAIPQTLFYCILLLVYFVTVNLIKTAEWIRRCILVLVCSASICATIGLFEYGIGILIRVIRHNESWSNALYDQEISIMGSATILGEYLILAFPIVIAFLFLTSKRRQRFPALIGLILCLLCLIVTWSTGAWFGAAVALTLFCLCKGKRSAIIFLSISIPLIVLYFCLPSTVKEPIALLTQSKSSTSYYASQIHSAASELLSKVWYCGIGWGDGAFSHYFPQFSNNSVAITANSHQLFLQIWISLGPIGLLLFAYILLLLLRYFCTLQVELRKHPSAPTFYLSLASLSAISALLAHGFTDYVWQQGQIFFLFWFLCALSVMIGRTYYREQSKTEEDPFSIDLPYQE